MYRRYIAILVVISAFLLGFSIAAGSSEITLVESRKFVENLMWESEALKKTERFREYEGLYLDLLTSENQNDVYVAAVMLGLLKTNAAANSLQSIQPTTTQTAIGVAFARCRLNIQYENNYKFLEQVGTKTQRAGEARSLANIDAIILMSFLGDKRFPIYVRSLSDKTEEVWQQEAIDAALLRYREIAH